MSDQHLDERDSELEVLLRATFSGEANRRVSDTAPVPPFPATDRSATVHPLRRRWTGVVLVAAALVGIVVGGTLIGREAMDARPSPSTPAGTSVAPTPSVTATGSATSSPTTAASTTSSAPAGPQTRDVQLGGGAVSLVVPFAWNDIPQRGIGDTNFADSVCLTTDSTITTTGPATDNCELNVSVGSSLSGDDDPDSPGWTPDGGLCGTSGQTPHETDTVTADEVTIDGQTAEHRVFTGFCLKNPVEQWTVPTAPFVQFWRARSTPDAEGEARALAIIEAATLPTPSALRLADHGYVTAVSGSTLSLDRFTVLRGRGVQDTNPRTYDYPLTAASRISFFSGNTVTLSIADLRTLATGGTVSGVPPLSTLYADVTTDGDVVTIVNLHPRES